MFRTLEKPSCLSYHYSLAKGPAGNEPPLVERGFSFALAPPVIVSPRRRGRGEWIWGPGRVKAYDRGTTYAPTLAVSSNTFPVLAGGLCPETSQKS